MKGDKINDKYAVTGSEGKLSVFYIDDDPLFLKTGKTFLEHSGDFAVTICGNAADAAELMSTKSFDAIISDFRLKECDCLHLLRNFREKGDNTPFIIFTGKGHEDAVIEALNSGADFYLQKKGDPKAEFAELSGRIKFVVSKSRSETLIKSFFYSHSDLMFVKDEKLRYIITNDAVQNFFGRSKKEMLYKTDSDLMNPDSARKCLESDEKTLQTGKKVISEEIVGDRIFETIKFPLEIADKKTGVGGVIRDITDRIRAGESLKKIEDLNRHIIDAIPDILIRCKRDGTITDIRAPDERLLLAPKSESLGRVLTEVIPGELGVFLMKKTRSALDTKEMERVEYALTLPKGLSYYEACIIPYLEDEVIALIRDITDRRKAEEELKRKNEELAAAEEELRQQLDEIVQGQEMLKENEAYIRTVLDNIPVGIAVNSVKPEVNFEYFNQNFLNYYHITAEELEKPDSFWDIVYKDPIFREEIKKRVLKDCESGDPEKMHWEEIPITRAGEETTFINARNIPLPKKGMVISMVWDVTDQKNTQDEIKREKELFLRTFESIQDAAFVVDGYPGSIQAVNEAAISLFGYSRKEMTGQTTDFLHVDNASLKSFHSHVSPYLKKHEPVPRFEFLMKRKDGTIFPTEHSVTPLYDSAGNLTGRVSIIRDITERVEAENREKAALTQIEENLEQLATLNDQIRNPLAVIAGIVDLKCPESSEKIFEQVRIINDIISMLDAGWVRSKKVWDFLKGNYGIGIEDTENKMEER
ncbi:PAS domain S-box protein [Methanomicrobium antiquum]|uniref:PAS domain S-box protein n=1 Tax=Methanomicrobium antiquum TaxID=487686 RepID=A0AAF0FSC7_9EURY|nr:PAS domain S-box protein [Methanomicrobium antiquum]WFN37246.1 PAS domain S-box protein [Methanomicrobium antiquum]